MFKGPVAWTGKRPETGPNWINLDWTAVAVAPPFWMDKPVKPVATASRYSFKYLQNAPKNIENDQDLNMLLNFTDGYEIHLVNTFKTHLQTLKTIKI